MKHKYTALFFLTALLLFQACTAKEPEPGNPDSGTDPISGTSSFEPEYLDLATSSPLSDRISEADLAPYFNEYDNAAMILSDGTSAVCYNRSFAEERQSPFSTFKIPNSLIALEEGIVRIEDSVRLWDGTVYNRSELNQDQNLPSAMKHSCVWYYQELAREIGPEAMENYLGKLGYGNADISGGIDSFWLGSTLAVAPREQLDFITKLYYDDLPFAEENMEYVKSILKQEGYSIDLYGKTGSSGRGQGWFTGYALFDGKPYFFAAYAEGEGVGGLQIRDLTARLLSDFFIENS